MDDLKQFLVERGIPAENIRRIIDEKVSCCHLIALLLIPVKAVVKTFTSNNPLSCDFRLTSIVLD